MSKRLITAAALMGLTLAGSFARADSQDQRLHRQLKNSFGLVVESSSRGGQDGVTISEVVTDSAADRAGLRQGDVIVRVGSRPIEDFRDLANAIQRSQQGDRVNIQVERNNSTRTVRVTPRMPGADDNDRNGSRRYGRAADDSTTGDTAFQRMQQRFRQLESRLQEMERRNQYGQNRGESADQDRDFQRLQQRLDQLEERVQQSKRVNRYGRNTSNVTLGVQVREWQRQADSPQGGSVEEGVEVMAVDPDSPASEAGLHRGDIIIRMDGRNVATRQELRQAWQRAAPVRT